MGNEVGVARDGRTMDHGGRPYPYSLDRITLQTGGRLRGRERSGLPTFTHKKIVLCTKVCNVDVVVTLIYEHVWFRYIIRNYSSAQEF